MSAPPAASPKTRAIRWLARREHTRAELERKLLRDVAEDDASARQAVQQALDELSAKGLLSDARAAESVVAARLARYGTRRLRQELQSRGVAPELIAHTLETTGSSELVRARALWQRKFGGTVPGTGAEGARERARQCRFLAARGFAPDLIRQIVQGAGVDDD